MHKNQRQLYETMKENGDLSIFFPNLSGEWQEDKHIFMREQNKLEEQANLDPNYDLD